MIPVAVLLLPAYFVLYVTLIGLTPDSWIWAKSTQNQDVDIAIILSFGYEFQGAQMTPGEANRALWKWIVNNKSTQLKTILIQEGIWVAADDDTLTTLNIERKRIHQHDPNIYVDTLNAAFCAVQQLQKMGKKKALLVAHDLQLQRVAWDFERISQFICPDCIFVTPKIRDIPYSPYSVHWQTRSKFVYKIVELLVARPRDFLSPIPTGCKAPIAPD